MLDFWIILTGLLTAIACALVGSILLLRKLSMMGDAISHAVLPGIVLAFLISGERSGPLMLLGAGSFGLLTVFITDLLNKRGRIAEDASMGIVFTSLFAIGVILVSAFAGKVDLDQECVLYGEIAYAPFDLWQPAGLSLVPRPVWMLGFASIANILFILLTWKELSIYCFDRGLGLALGLPMMSIHYMLMGMVSMTTVAAFESVGAILVVALLIVPPATAYLITSRMSAMVRLSVVFGAGAALLGYGIALLFEGSIAGGMAVAAGIQFALVLAWVMLKKKRAIRLST